MVGEYLYSLKADSEMRTAQGMAASADQALMREDMDALWAVCRDPGPDRRVLIVDPQGAVLADSRSELNGETLSQVEVARALETGTEQFTGYYASSEPGRLESLYAVPLSSGGALCYVTQSDRAYDALAQFKTRLILWLAAVAAVVLCVVLIMSRGLTRPIQALSRGIGQMTQGDYSARVEVTGRGELSQLNADFNQMCDRIQSLDKARGQFVSNASHELRTPLSTMKILIESVLYQDPMDPDMARDFLRDVDSEIDRLNSVIADLLTLVSMDNGNEIERKPLSLNNLLDETARRLQPLARERGIEMTLSIRDQIAVAGDSGKLERVFYNLIDNAIKYTGRGGQIRVEMQRSGRKASVRVSDTGIGIPLEDQQHVFDRFYRVDKARSRETGGTGLGLSIVRQIVLMHGGQVWVNSDGPNKGSTFTVELPELAGRG